MHNKKNAILVAGLLLLAVGCGDDDDGSAGSGTTTSVEETTAADGESSTSDPTTLSVETVPPSDATSPADPAATGQILMVKLFVGDADEAQDFYGGVFGATSAADMGGGIHIVTFPDGGPGLVLIPTDDEEMRGAFIMQVPDLEASKALALDHGATEQQSFSGEPGGQAARSVDILDPWGNQVEILQLG